MRLFDQEKETLINDLLILLTIDEALELKCELERLIQQQKTDDHGHINNEDYTKEITVSVYDPNNIDNFSRRIKNLIIDDK
ncbi:hypothetical protein EYV94_18630 [Puteibacter caeruleilacunae]|nr:hypothetical protein EYV94_18630 [Puteibacter caeruleilacunae]